MKAKTRKPRPQNSSTETALAEVDRILGVPPEMQRHTVTFFPWSNEGNSEVPLITQEVWLTEKDAKAMALQLARVAKTYLPKSVC